MDPFRSASPKTVKRALISNISQLRELVRAAERDLHEFDDVKRLKVYLKSVKRELAAQHDDDFY
jgi:archaellum component FlaC